MTGQHDTAAARDTQERQTAAAGTDEIRDSLRTFAFHCPVGEGSNDPQNVAGSTTNGPDAPVKAPRSNRQLVKARAEVADPCATEHRPATDAARAPIGAI